MPPFHRTVRRLRFELTGEDAQFSSRVGRAVVAEHFDRVRRLVSAKALFDCLEHHVADPLMPAFTTARQAMSSRSWASMMNAPLTMSPFQQVNSKPTSTGWSA